MTTLYGYGPPGGVTVPPVTAGWLFSDPAYPKFDTMVCNTITEDPASFVIRRSVALGCVDTDDGTAAEHIRESDRLIW